MGLSLCLLTAACGDLQVSQRETSFERIVWTPKTQNAEPAPVAPAPPPPVSPPRRPHPPAAVGGGQAGVWECIKHFESGGNYANKNNPAHRGAYQFSYATWRSVGGQGDPADASVEEQDRRARDLQRRSGWSQWSTHSRCGV